MGKQRNPNNELMCCLACGRDTTAKTGYCFACSGSGSASAQISDQKGRKCLAPGRSHDADAGYDSSHST